MTFLFVMLAWVPFRAENWNIAKSIYRSMFMPNDWTFPSFTPRDMLLFAAGVIIVLFFKPVCEVEKSFRPTWIRAIIATALIASSMFCFVKYSPFIYFNF